MMKKTFLFLTLTYFAVAPVFAQGDVQIKTTHVAGNIYMLEGQGGNIGASIGDDGIVVIDDQFAPLSEKIMAALKGIKDAPIKFVINTHYHPDHTGGNEAFGKVATLISHENVRKRLSEGQFMAFFQNQIDPAPNAALPVITFDESLSIHLNGEEIKVMHLPHGHTDGDSVIYFTGSNVVHTGDHFFKDRFPFVDLAGGGNAIGYVKNIKKMLNEIADDTKIIPGHGSLATKAELQNYYDMLVETTEEVRKKVKEGKPLEEIQEEGLDPKWASYSESFIKEPNWIAFIYESLNQE